MSSSSFGRLLTLTTFGESHGKALGGVVDGYPARIRIDEEFIKHEMDRRRPGGNKLGTSRSEEDDVIILSGVFEGFSTGHPIAFMIENRSQKSKDYSEIANLYRPGHADFTYMKKYGIRDYRGGGRSSGRETSCRVAAGALAKLFLKEKGITIDSATIRIGSVSYQGNPFTEERDTELLAPLSVAPRMRNAILDAKADGDSVGGIIECRIKGVPAGLGDPVFEKLDANLAKAMLSIGACKGFEVGLGFKASEARGSENNDEMRFSNGKEMFLSNNAGGILGGISTGEEIIFRAAFKPTPSISKGQSTVTCSGEEVGISIKGRHDPCIVPRALVVVEAMAALTIMDAYLVNEAYK